MRKTCSLAHIILVLVWSSYDTQLNNGKGLRFGHQNGRGSE